MPAAFSTEIRPLTQVPEWEEFAKQVPLADRRASSLRVIKAASLHVDLSGQVQSPALEAAGEALLKARHFEQARKTLFEGGIANPTEHRAAWHTALRSGEPPAEVARERQRVIEFARKVQSEGRFTSVVHIGIGGSDWGPRLCVRAFGNTGTRIRIRFASNIDGHAVQGAVAGLDPHKTLIIVSSKTFTTTETLRNAERAFDWLRKGGVENPKDHLVAVTASPKAAAAYGAKPEHTFQFWDYVGGRYSLWAAIGLPVALAIGVDAYEGLLFGAEAMDKHFATAPLADNAPVQLALAGVANRSVLNYGSLNIAAYDARLVFLSSYLQQLDMESLGKSVDLAGNPSTVPTGAVVWGMAGTDAQHTFFQWLHQGTDGAPVDFIMCREADHPHPEHHRLLLANCLAQREALLQGKDFESALAETRRMTKDAEEAEWLAKHRVHPGGRPSTLIVLPRLTPYTLGALLAMYEHKVFTQGVLWGINPFDQWGVEYGKVLAAGISRELDGGDPSASKHDVSTAHWINVLRT